MRITLTVDTRTLGDVTVHVDTVEGDDMQETRKDIEMAAFQAVDRIRAVYDVALDQAAGGQA